MRGHNICILTDLTEIDHNYHQILPLIRSSDWLLSVLAVCLLTTVLLCILSLISLTFPELQIYSVYFFMDNCKACQCLPFRQKCMDCSIINPALLLLMKHLVIGWWQKAPNFSAFHWSVYRNHKGSTLTEKIGTS